jgi:hypothetical protein
MYLPRTSPSLHAASMNWGKIALPPALSPRGLASIGSRQRASVPGLRQAIARIGSKLRLLLAARM